MNSTLNKWINGRRVHISEGFSYTFIKLTEDDRSVECRVDNVDVAKGGVDAACERLIEELSKLKSN